MIENTHTRNDVPRLRALSFAIAMALGMPVAQAATITVNDSGDPAPSTSPGTCTLRQAVVAINALATGGNAGNCANTGAAFGTSDTILFSNAVTSISLDGAANGELDVLSGSDLTINGGSGLGQVTISRSTGGVSVIGNRGTNLIANLTLTGLTITNGNAVSNGSFNGFGGGVYLGSNRGNSASTLTLNNCVVSGNFADTTGGGVYADSLVLNNSKVSGNRTNATGGGITAYQTLVSRSTIENNQAYTRGGGIYGYAVSVNDSVISGNSVTATDGEGPAVGGGIFAYAGILATNTVVSTNTSAGSCGGIAAIGNIFLTDSTVSGNNNVAACSSPTGGLSATNTTFTQNATASYAQAIYSGGGVILSNSTISGNSGPVPTVVVGSYLQAPGSPGLGARLVRKQPRNFGHHANRHGVQGGRTHHAGPQFLNASSLLTLVSSIVSQNNDAPFDIGSGSPTIAEGGFNIIGSVGNSISLASLTNEVSGNPNLLALADNGCALPAGEPTTSAQCVKTLAVPAGSIAINTGNANGNITDERGTGFARVFGPAADIGAYELVAGPPVASPGTANTAINTPVGIVLHATDANAGTSPFTFTIVTPPAHGTVTLGAPTTTGMGALASAGSVQFSYSIQASNGTVTATYTPGPNYSGPDAFSFTATNASGTSAPATVSITVAAAPPAFQVTPAPALSRWAWLALIAQLGWVALYKLRQLGMSAVRRKPRD